MALTNTRHLSNITSNPESRRQVIDTTTALKRLVISRCLEEISSTQFAIDCAVVMGALSCEEPKATKPPTEQ